VDVPFLLECRSAKEKLSNSPRTVILRLIAGKSRPLPITKECFEGLIRERVNKTMRKTAAMLEQARSAGCEVDTVVLVGGSARVPLVVEELNGILARSGGKAALLKYSNQDVAVALGCSCAAKPQAAPRLLSPQSLAQNAPTVVRENPKDGLKYVWIPPGTFMMGCSLGDNECLDDEKPYHQVKISKGFWMGQTAVTVGAYKRFAQQTVRGMPPEPIFAGRNLNGGWANDQMPIVNVTWDDAQAYCAWAGGRLPTEAEWEYGARGGSNEARYGPLEDVAWYADNSGNQRLDSRRIPTDIHDEAVSDNRNGVHEVGKKRPNGFGLYDTLGNVWQWVSDWCDKKPYHTISETDPKGPSIGQYCVTRGGSWYSNVRFLRVSSRFGCLPNVRLGDLGFRSVWGIAGPSEPANAPQPPLPNPELRAMPKPAPPQSSGPGQRGCAFYIIFAFVCFLIALAIAGLTNTCGR
jgi:formylglycine-generating enzyme required for sulfatase activity